MYEPTPQPEETERLLPPPRSSLNTDNSSRSSRRPSRQRVLHLLDKAVQVTLSPQMPQIGHLPAPPFLSLLITPNTTPTTTPPSSPKQKKPKLTTQRSRSLSPKIRRTRSTTSFSHPNTPRQKTVLTISKRTPGLKLSISPQLRPQDDSKQLLPIWPPLVLDSTLKTEIKSPSPSSSEESEDFQIILPGDESHWTIAVKEPKTPAAAQPSPTPLDREARYRARLMNVAYHLLLVALVSPNAMNAFCEPSSIRPADITANWWNNLSSEVQFLSITNAVFSTVINVFVQRDFIPQALKELREGFGICFTSPSHFFSNTLILISSSAAAFAFAAMSYEAFKWVGEGGAALSGLASLSTSISTRYTGVKKATQKIKLSLDKNMRAQKEMADTLRHLKPAFAMEASAFIRTQQLKLNGKDLALLLNYMGAKAENRPRNTLLFPKSPQECFTSYFMLLLEMTFTLTISSAAFLTFTQKGFDGSNAIAHLFGGNLNYLSPFEGFSIGVVGGTVSSMLYQIAALNLLPSVYQVGKDLAWDTLSGGKRLLSNPRETLKETYRHPERFYRYCILILAAIAVWRSSGAMITVGNGVVRNKKGIFSSLFNFLPGYAFIFPILNGFGGIAINFTSTINQLLKNERNAKKLTPDLDDFTTHLETTPLPANMEIMEDDQPKSVPTLSYLRGLSLFKALPTTPAEFEVEMTEIRGRPRDESDEEGISSDEESRSLLVRNQGCEEAEEASSSCAQQFRSWFGIR